MNKAFEKIIDELKQESIIVDDDAGHRAVEIIQQIAEKYNNGWIPCSERLPEEATTVLLQDFDGFYQLGVCTVKNGLQGFADGDWWASSNNFIAWQPLPEPYKGESE